MALLGRKAARPSAPSADAVGWFVADPTDFGQLDRDIRAGLLFDAARRDAAHHNRRFFEGKFAEYPTRRTNAPGRRDDFRRTSRFMRRVIQALTSSLYKRDPQRTLAAGPEATDWLTRCYQRLGMGSKWAKADQLSLVGDVAAFQFVGGTDPEFPVRVNLWPADQLTVWLDPEDPLEPCAVATLDAFDARRRLRLYTRTHVATYLTKKLGPEQTTGGTSWELQSSGATPYVDAAGKGFLPFAFVHVEEPTVDFWASGLGDFLREANDFLNFRLDRLGDSIRFIETPLLIASGVAGDWTPPADIQPGDIIRLPAFVANVGEEGAALAPTLTELSRDLSYIAADWLDMNNMIDHALESCGIPPGSIRMMTRASSGVQVLIEQAPLLAWAEDRRKPFARYEERAAQVCCQVAALQLRRHGGAAMPWLEDAAATPGLSLEWAPLYVTLPGPERDRADGFELGLQLTSKLQLLMSRYALSRDQALQRLAQVVQDNADLVALGLDPAGPSPPPPPGSTAPPAADGEIPADQVPAE